MTRVMFHQCANLSISQNFISCFFFHNLYFLSQNMYQNYTKIGKFRTHLGTHKKLTLKLSLNVYILSRRMYSINSTITTGGHRMNLVRRSA